VHTHHHQHRRHSYYCKMNCYSNTLPRLGRLASGRIRTLTTFPPARTVSVPVSSSSPLSLLPLRRAVPPRKRAWTPPSRSLYHQRRHRSTRCRTTLTTTTTTRRHASTTTTTQSTESDVATLAQYLAELSPQGQQALVQQLNASARQQIHQCWQVHAVSPNDPVAEPSWEDLKALALNTAIPFVGTYC
jgi:hypothetical protein